MRPYVTRSLLLLSMIGYEGVRSERFCHHERIWGSALGRLLADLCWIALPFGWARGLALASGAKFVRWACERQVLAAGVKPG